MSAGAGAGAGTGTGAGAGVGVPRTQTFFRPHLRAPNAAETLELQQILQSLETEVQNNSHDPEELVDFLFEHRDVRVNDIYRNDPDGSNYYTDRLNVYGILMLSPRINIENEILLEIMRRRPDPEKVSMINIPLTDMLQVEIDQAIENDDEEVQELFQNKLDLANFYKAKFYGKNLSSLALASKNFFGKKQISSNVEEIILKYLTNEQGTLPIQLSKYRVKYGLPGVVNKSEVPNAKGGTHKKSRKRRITTRKSRRKSRKL